MKGDAGALETMRLPMQLDQSSPAGRGHGPAFHAVLASHPHEAIIEKAARTPGLPRVARA